MANCWVIIFGALIFDRTAIEGCPAKDGSIFIVPNKKRSIKIGKIAIKTKKELDPLMTTVLL